MISFFLVSSPIFAVVALGWAAARAGLLSPAGIAAFAAYAFDLALPALLVGLLARQPLSVHFDLRFFGALLAAGLLVFGATAVLATTVGRTGLRHAGALAQAATNGNLGFLGVPLLLAVLGDRAAGPLAMAVLAEVGILMPLGLLLMGARELRPGAPGALAREIGRATVGNPIVLGVLAGAAVGIAGARLPGPVDRFLSFVGASAGPTALFALGGSLAGRRIGGAWRSIAAVSVAKLAVYPAVAWVLLRATGLPAPAVGAGGVVGARPPAGNRLVLAQRHDAGAERISAEILLTTLAGAVSFPLVAWLVLR